MRKMRFEVLGKPWTLRILSKKEFKKRHGSEGALAITDTIKKVVDLSPFGVDLETIDHELFHVLVHELCLTSTIDIKFEDAEEIFAELHSKRARELHALGEKLAMEVSLITNSKKLKKEG